MIEALMGKRKIFYKKKSKSKAMKLIRTGHHERTQSHSVISIFAEFFFHRRRISPIPISPKTFFADDEVRRFQYRRMNLSPRPCLSQI